MRLRHFALTMIPVIALVTLAAQALPSQSPNAKPQDDPERQHALELYQAGKFVEAMPLLEKLSTDHPSDIALKESWAYSILEYSATLTDPQLRRKARIRGRGVALEAKQLGDNSGLLQVMLDIPEDGSEPTFSDRAEVDQVMKAAEADFARGDLDKAREGYLRTLLLDPTNYAAALFMRDTYFKQHQNGSAGEWFARAIQIDPNRETAYRYWGDALWDMGKSAEARDKYIQAVVADPYDHSALGGLNQWAQRTKTPLNWVRLQDKSSVTQKDDKNINITLDDSLLKKNDPNLTAWMAYGLSRASWRGDKFKKEFPNEPKYRRTMREEADSLHTMIAVMREQKDSDKKKPPLDPALLQLLQIDQAGFLDPFALLNRADNEIAQDYAPYRSAHRDIIYRYFDEFVVPKAAMNPPK